MYIVPNLIKDKKPPSLKLNVYHNLANLATGIEMGAQKFFFNWLLLAFKAFTCFQSKIAQLRCVSFRKSLNLSAVNLRTKVHMSPV